MHVRVDIAGAYRAYYFSEFPGCDMLRRRSEDIGNPYRASESPRSWRTWRFTAPAQEGDNAAID
jgi:hypothetical protein